MTKPRKGKKVRVHRKKKKGPHVKVKAPIGKGSSIMRRRKKETGKSLFRGGSRALARTVQEKTYRGARPCQKAGADRREARRKERLHPQKRAGRLRQGKRGATGTLDDKLPEGKAGVAHPSEEGKPTIRRGLAPARKGEPSSRHFIFKGDAGLPQ